jgi:hypothetical protein
MWMLRALATIVVLAGCYEAPDYRSTHFKCDDTHACPDGQSCITGTCMVGGSEIDANGSGSQEGVACAGTTCTGGDNCCVDFVGSPHCIPAGTFCNGYSASCDGTEDCAGSPCCLITGGTQTACGASCTNQACLDNTDCLNASMPMCCLGGLTPWGRCMPAC